MPYVRAWYQVTRDSAVPGAETRDVSALPKHFPEKQQALEEARAAAGAAEADEEARDIGISLYGVRDDVRFPLPVCLIDYDLQGTRIWANLVALEALLIEHPDT